MPPQIQYQRSKSARLPRRTLGHSQKLEEINDNAPIYYQQQILLRKQRRETSKTRRSPPAAVVEPREARLVTLNQPAQHFYHYDTDDMFSETSVVGYYEERVTSISKCLNWMSKLNDSDLKKSPSRSKKTTAAKHQTAVEQSPVIGAGEALAYCPCKSMKSHQRHRPSQMPALKA